MKVYEAIVKGLEGIGVTAAFGGAGENAAGLMIALKHSEQIRPVIARHEQAASFMACGYAMYTDRLGVCFATAGPGAFNLFSGLAVAMSDSYPVLAISGYSSLEWEGRGSLNETSGLNNTPDSRAMFAATTKGSFLIRDIADTCDILEQAVNLAFEGRPGPVHIHVPENLTEHGLEVPNYRDIRLSVTPVRPDPGRVDEIAAVLADAISDGEPIVALVGSGAIRSGAGEEVRRFIERFQIPLVTTLDGKGIVSEGHPLCAGVLGDCGHASARKAFRGARVVLGIGNALNQHSTFSYHDGLFDGKVHIRINISATEIDKLKDVYRADYALVSDARVGVAALADALEARVGEVKTAHVEGQDYEERPILDVTGQIHPGRLAQSIGRMLPPGAALLADAGAHLAWLGYYVELADGQNFRKAGEFGPMAGHVNGALGLKIAHPERTVVVGCGDGCYLLAGFELMTAVQYQIPVIWIIFDDKEFKLIKLYQLEAYHETGLVEFQNPDFAAYARACGADGYRVDTLEDFEDAYRAALDSGRPSVIDARITRWAVPHYSPSPDGMIAGFVEAIEARLRSG
jgi:acetolactate synthase I/II/III large subunit